MDANAATNRHRRRVQRRLLNPVYAFHHLRWKWRLRPSSWDGRYVRNDALLPDDFDIDAVAARLIREHGETLRRLAEDD